MSVKRKFQQYHQGRLVFQYLLTFILSNFLCILFSQSTFAAPNISISIVGDTNVHADFPTSGKVEASKTADITVNSDGVFGYKLFMSSDSENTALTSPDASNADYISSVSGSGNKLSEDMHNQYGYNIENTDNKLYNAIPALGTPEMIKRVKTKLKSADIIKFNLGFELENTITPGSYKRKLIFSLISDEQASAQLVSGLEINKALKRPTTYGAADDPIAEPLYSNYDVNIRVGVEKCEEVTSPENISVISVPDSEVEVYLGVGHDGGQYSSYHACIWSYATELIFPEDLSYMYAGFQNLSGDAGFSFYDGRSVSMLNFKKTKDISHLFHSATPGGSWIDTSTLKFFELFKNSPIENAESIFENSGVYKIGSDFEFIANKAKNFKNAFKDINLSPYDYKTTNWLFNNAEDTSSMFEGFKSSEIKLPNATFAKVKNATSMFKNVKSLSTFELNQATFAAAEDVSSMFEDVYFKDTLKMNSATFLVARNASNMFKNSEISSIPITINVFKNLDNAESMFENAKSDNVDFSNTTFQNVKNAQNMFNSVEINTVSLPSATFNSVVNANAMFMYSQISTLTISQATFANAEDISSMFESTQDKLVAINLQSATFAHAKNAHRMLYGGRLTSVNLSNAVFNELEDASSMFEDQDYITEIKLPKATFDKTRNFNRTFFSVSATTIISLPKITFRAAEDLTSMFHDCYYMTTLNLNPSKMIASHVVTMESMFKGVGSMTEINLEKLNVNGGTLQNIQEIFKDNRDTAKIILPTVFDTSNVTNMASAFENCQTLTEIGNYSQLNLKSVTNASRLFAGDQSLDLKQIIPLLKTNSIENASFMFYLAYSSASVAFSNDFKTNSTTTMQGMFQGFMTPSLDISHFSLENTTTMEDMFSGKEVSTWAVGGQYYAVSEVIWPNSILNAPHLTTMKSLFHKNYHITKLNLPKFVSPALTDTSFMFFQLDKEITAIEVNGLDTQNVEDMSEMFEGLKFDRGSLGGSFAPKFKTTSLKNMYGMFYAMNVDHLDLTAFDVSNVTNMEYTLGNAYFITIDLTGWNTSNVENMRYLFYNNWYLTTIYASDSFVTTKVTQSEDIFNMNGYDNLVGGNGTHAAGQDITYARIDRPGKPGAFTLK